VGIRAKDVSGALEARWVSVITLTGAKTSSRVWDVKNDVRLTLVAQSRVCGYDPANGRNDCPKGSWLRSPGVCRRWLKHHYAFDAERASRGIGAITVGPAAPQAGYLSNGLKRLLSILGPGWSGSEAGGQPRVVGHVSRLKRLGEIAEGACGNVVVRHRPRLGRALGLGVSVAMCVVSVTALVKLMQARALVWRDGAWVSRVNEHVKLSCGYVTKVTSASGVSVDRTHEHKECSLGGGASYNWKLVEHLQTYSLLKKRDTALLQSLVSRAKAWQVDNEVSNACYASYAPISIMLAMCASESEYEAARLLGSMKWAGTKRVFGAGMADVSRYESWSAALGTAGWNGLLEHVTASGEGLVR